MSDVSFTTVFTATSFQEAQIVAGFLESEGIKTRIPGSGLLDEIGMANKLTGFAEVSVMNRDLEAAQDMMAAWVERKNQVNEGPAED